MERHGAFEGVGVGFQVSGFKIVSVISFFCGLPQIFAVKLRFLLDLSKNLEIANDIESFGKSHDVVVTHGRASKIFFQNPT